MKHHGCARKKVALIEQILPLILRVWGESNDVKLAIGGDRAYHDWNTGITHIPQLPVDDEKAAIFAFGFCGHEAGHVAFTDPEQKKDLDTSSDIQRSMYQSIEDIRIEARQTAVRPGIGKRLGQLVTELVNKGDFAKPDAGDHPAQLLKAYVLYRMRYELLGQKGLAEYGPLAEALFREVMPPALVTRVSAIMAKVPTLTCTKDSVVLSADILRAVSDTIDELQQEQQSEPDSSPASDPSDSSDQDSSAGTHGNSGDTGDEGDAGGSQASSGSGNDPEQAARLLQEILDASTDDVMDDIGEAAAKELESISAEVERSGGGASAGFAASPVPLTGDPGDLLTRVRVTTRALRTKLIGVLQAWEDVYRQHAMDGNRMDSRRLVDATLGEPNIFVRRRKTPSLTSDVVVLLDRSGSMSQAQQELAVESVLSLGLALDMIEGAGCATSTFPGSGGPVQPLTQFGECVSRSAPRYSNIRPSGGTPLGDALIWAYEQLAVRDSDRKLVLVVTDGDPNSPEYVKKLIAAGSSAGIEVYGIGIHCDTGKQIFPLGQWEYIRKIDELPRTVFNLVRRGLLKAA